MRAKTENHAIKFVDVWSSTPTDLHICDLSTLKFCVNFLKMKRIWMMFFLFICSSVWLLLIFLFRIDFAFRYLNNYKITIFLIWFQFSIFHLSTFTFISFLNKNISAEENENKSKTRIIFRLIDRDVVKNYFQKLQNWAN